MLDALIEAAERSEHGIVNLTGNEALVNEIAAHRNGAKWTMDMRDGYLSECAMVRVGRVEIIAGYRRKMTADERRAAIAALQQTTNEGSDK